MTKPEYKIKSLRFEAGRSSYRNDIYNSVKQFIIDNNGPPGLDLWGCLV